MGLEVANYPSGLYETDDVELTDADVMRQVRDALTSVQCGHRDDYDHLVGVMHYKCRGFNGPDEVGALETSLKALSGSVAFIDVAHHADLLESIFKMRLWDYRPEVMDSLVDLITSLAVTSGKYLDPCLDMLVRDFTPPEKLPEMRVRYRKQEVLSRVHTALQKISYLVPLAPIRLLPILTRNMPIKKTERDRTLVLYMENLLKLESSSIGEVVGGMIFMVIMEKLRDLDVEIGWDDILQDYSSKGIFDMELEDELEDADDDLEGVNNGDEFSTGLLNRKTLRGNIVADLLDEMMVQTFEHLESCQNAGRLDEVFEILFKSFENIVLNTYKSKFSQFVLFYACSLDPENCGIKFATKLVDIFISSNKPPLTKMSAVAYLSSYLSRAKFLSASFVASVLKRLVDWCAGYCRTCIGDITPEAHRIFYSGCQAIMYILCFHMRSILAVPRLQSQLTPLESILKHELKPLIVCLPSVVAEFLRQAKAAYLFTISETFIFDDLLESDLSRAFGGRERLDMFFPFDPCLLKKSDNYIRRNFVRWSSVRTYDDEDESLDDVAEVEVFVSGDDDDGDEMMGRSLKEEEEGDLDTAMNKMSITPKHSFKNMFEQGRLLRMPSRIRPSTSPESL